MGGDGDVPVTEFPNIGSDETLEIGTWNLEYFPKSYHTTVEYAGRVIRDIDVDILALQEIESSGYFQILLDELHCRQLETDTYGDCADTLGWGETGSGCELLTGCSTVNEYEIDDAEWIFSDSLDCMDQCSVEWEGFRASSASYNLNLAYIYNASVIQPVDIYEIYEDDWWSFPRSPLVFEFYWDGQYFIVINNHFKCCGGSENEDRRESASLMLELYIDTYFQNKQVIVVGDWNEDIENNNSGQSFWNFISNSEDYQFADMTIAEGNSYNWSYPTWPSHIDHILLTDELFEFFNHGASDVQTLLVDEYLEGGWSEYDAILSDHRPVVLKLDFNE